MAQITLSSPLPLQGPTVMDCQLPPSPKMKVVPGEQTKGSVVSGLHGPCPVSLPSTRHAPLATAPAHRRAAFDFSSRRLSCLDPRSTNELVHPRWSLVRNLGHSFDGNRWRQSRGTNSSFPLNSTIQHLTPRMQDSRIAHAGAAYQGSALGQTDHGPVQFA